MSICSWAVNTFSFVIFATKQIKSKQIRLKLKPHLHGRLFAGDFLIQIYVAKLHVFNNGSHCDKSYLTAENDCLKLFPFR